MAHKTCTPSNSQEYTTELRVLMLRMGLTQRGLAELLGVRREYLNRVLTGAQAGYRIRARLVREFDFPEWILDPMQREATRAA